MISISSKQPCWFHKIIIDVACWSHAFTYTPLQRGWKPAVKVGSFEWEIGRRKSEGGNAHDSLWTRCPKLLENGLGNKRLSFCLLCSTRFALPRGGKLWSHSHNGSATYSTTPFWPIKALLLLPFPSLPFPLACVRAPKLWARFIPPRGDNSSGRRKHNFGSHHLKPCALLSNIWQRVCKGSKVKWITWWWWSCKEVRLGVDDLLEGWHRWLQFWDPFSCIIC